MTMWVPNLGDRRGPRYQAIAKALEADVLSGRLAPGERMPTHRELADRLGITVGTVTRAYAEARRAGWISGEVGRGTFVLQRGVRFPRDRDTRAAVIDLGLNVPVDLPAPNLAAAFGAILASGDAAALLRYAEADQTRHLAAAAAVLKQHGVEVAGERIVVSAGATHGLGIVLDVITRPGDSVLAEELTYPAFRPLVETRGLRLCPVALDGEGIAPAALDAACRKVRPKALYLLPTLHNPTTGTMSLERRKAVVAVARKHDLTIIEDDVYGMLAPDGPPHIVTLAPERTVYVTSLSKSFAPGLRHGYLLGPAALRARLQEAVQRSMWMVSPVTTALATHWVMQGEFAAIAAGKRREAAARQTLAARVLPRTHMRTAPTAYHVWLQTPNGADAFALAARERGVIVTPGRAFYLGSGAPPDAVRVSLSAAPDRSLLMTALTTLGHLLDGPAAASDSGRSRAVI